jgi:hypothetical protein
MMRAREAHRKYAGLSLLTVKHRYGKEVAIILMCIQFRQIGTSTEPPCTHSGPLASTVLYSSSVHFLLVGLAALRGESHTYETTIS